MDIGKITDHTKFFNSCRNDSLNQIANQTNNLIIRLDKLINKQSDDDISRKDFEKKIVPWSDNSEFPNCRSCNMKFSLTKRKHHCRLCGKIMCQNCSLYLSFSSARKLTGPEFANNIFDELVSDKLVPTNDNKIVALPRMSTDSLQFVKSTTGKLFGHFIGTAMGNGDRDVFDNNGATSEESLDKLRICDLCKNLLDRREEAMDLRTAHSVFVDVYQKLCTLLTQISNLAPSYRHMAESLNNGESIYTLEAANELRRKLVSVQREITSLSERIENWGLTNADPLITNKPNAREIILQRNIKILAINTLHNAVSTMPDLPNEEDYQKLRAVFKAKLLKRIEQEKANASAFNAPIRSFPSNPVLGSFVRDRRSESPGSNSLMDGNRHNIKSTVALSVHENEDRSFVSSSPFQRNPFIDDDSETLHVIQQQYLNIKSFLEQAAQAGRLEEVNILEKSLIEVETELKNLELPTPRLSSNN